MTYPMVGPVRLETADGHPIETQRCTKHARLRPYQLLYRGLMYVQARHDPDGVWVYKAAHEVKAVGHDVSDLSLEPIDG